ncbi:hypothetical protein Golob_019836 [Gossypium lobatum]|uniref:Uncharacterized protein n=1 Tax=Gossypium lobatum TaxID=34289 RepID=A0A7J8L8I2_9ROSI|nr:hypothetical protein [Gossypium lobatum]
MRRSSSNKSKEEGEEEENKNSQKIGEEKPLSPSFRLFHESNFNIYVIAIMGCKTRIYPDIFKANLSHTLLRHPRFSGLQVMDERNKGEMKWVRTQVDLEKHVIVPKLDPNIDSPEKFLEDYIYNLSKSSIDESIHHSFDDGTSLMSILLVYTHQMNDPLALPTVFLNTVVDIFMFIATALFLKDIQNPLKGPRGA